MPWFPNPNGGAPIQAATNPNPAGGSYGLYSDPSYNGPAPSVGGATTSGGGGSTSSGGGSASSPGSAQAAAGVQGVLGAASTGNAAALAETIREYNQTFGLDTQKFTDDVRRFNENLAISQAGLTGTYQGAPTQAALAQQAGLTGLYQGTPTMAYQAQNAGLYGNAGQAPMANQTTLAAQQQAYTQQMGAITAAAALQANPFRQAQVIGQAGRVLQGMPTAGFQAPNVVTGVGTAGGNTQGGLGYLQQLIDDIKSPQANQTTAQSWLDATPTPNKIDSASFLKSTPTTQNLILQSMQEKYGLDPQDSLKQIQNTLPQFNAPSTLGTVRRG
jgi:hypothetical protein